ncbi:18302_t:CDS:1, partial [Gigaspora margarita]
MNDFDKGSKFNLCSSKSIFSSNYKKPDSGEFVDVLDYVNNYDFYHDKTINSNTFDQNNESKETLKKKKCQKSTIWIAKKEVNEAKKNSKQEE